MGSRLLVPAASNISGRVDWAGPAHMLPPACERTLLAVHRSNRYRFPPRSSSAVTSWLVYGVALTGVAVLSTASMGLFVMGMLVWVAALVSGLKPGS